MRNISD